MSQALEQGRISSEDAMGASKEQIDAWLAGHSQPLILAAAQTFPAAAMMKDTTAKGMDRYIGLALLANEVLPNKIFWDSLLFTGSTGAKDYPTGLLTAAAEPDEYEVNIPDYLANKPIWLPLGKGHLMGGKILRAQSGWSLVQAPAGKLTVKNR